MALITLGCAILYAISLIFINREEKTYLEIYQKYEREADRKYLEQVAKETKNE